MNIARIGVGMVGLVALVGCVENECGDGNDRDRTFLTVGLSRLSLNDRARDNETDTSQQWFFCDVKGVLIPPAGSGWTPMTIDATRNVINGIGGWMRVQYWDADRFRRAEPDEAQRWRMAALTEAHRITNGSPRNITCHTPKELLEDLQRFVECKEPVEHGPATPGGGTDPTPLPPGGSTGGDR